MILRRLRRRDDALLVSLVESLIYSTSRVATEDFQYVKFGALINF